MGYLWGLTWGKTKSKFGLKITFITFQVIIWNDNYHPPTPEDEAVRGEKNKMSTEIFLILTGTNMYSSKLLWWRNEPASCVPAGINYRGRTTDRQIATVHTKTWLQIHTHIPENKEIEKSRLSVQSLILCLYITNNAILITCLHAAFIDWA